MEIIDALMSPPGLVLLLVMAIALKQINDSF